MEFIDGQKIASQIISNLKKKVSQIQKKPCLAVVLVGQDKASQIYLKIKEKKAQEIGLGFKKNVLAESSSEQNILDLISSLNKDKQISGLMIQLPLPSSFQPDKIIAAIDSAKDVDGLKKNSPFVSPFILAIYQALESTKENLAGKKIVALVNSDNFGKKLEHYFNQQGYQLKYALSQDKKMAQQADVLMTALGQPKLITKDWLKKGVIIIDGGISWFEGKAVGDVDADSASKKASWLSPVPGGVGPLTVANLLSNVILSSRRENDDQKSVSG